MQSIDNDLSTYCDINLNDNLFCESASNLTAAPQPAMHLTTPQQGSGGAQLKRLLAEIEDKNAIIKNMKKNEEFYTIEINNLKNRLNEILEESAMYKMSAESLNKSESSLLSKQQNRESGLLDKEDLINLDTSSSSTISSKSTSHASSSSSSKSSHSSTTQINENVNEARCENAETDHPIIDIDEEEKSEACGNVDANSLNVSRASEKSGPKSILNVSQEYASSLKKVIDEKDSVIHNLSMELQKAKCASLESGLDNDDVIDYKAKYLELKEGSCLI
jgi:hypothetical protein